MHALKIAFLVCLTALPAQASVGFRHFELPQADDRTLDVAVWYPSNAAGTPTRQGEDDSFILQPALPDAAIAPGRHPLVVLSHGYGGNWTNQDWLAADLVRQGYVVAAVNHPGTTSSNMDPAIGGRLWERPRDVSALLDRLTSDPAWSIDANRIAAIGHSLGGWTVTELAGGRFDPDAFEKDCRDHAELVSCRGYVELGAGKDDASRTAMRQSFEDPRIKAGVTLDAAATRGFDPRSLAGVKIPMLVIAAGTPGGDLPAALESHRMADLLPAATTRYVEIGDAVHYSFLPVCVPDAAKRLSGPSATICDDNGDRETIHRQTSAEIERFLAKVLQAKD
ncbi:alpha/beta hydrolase family protein [Mesorhizobium sp. NPDC059054]|uniref:alpha/beta hydrolase family protein n=1 Tax=Mesorhizobium sp. NPDC059054 TaxID=3346711 RepID=UPI003681E1D3